jgi:integrase/recombinase XerD
MTYAITRARALPVVASPDRPLSRRRFDNRLLLEKFENYLTAVNYSVHTRVRYTGTARQFNTFLNGKNLASVNRNDVSNFLAMLMEKKLQPITLANALFSLRSLYKFLQLGDQVLASAPHFIATRKFPLRLPKAKSEAEIEQIINAAQSPRDRAILELLYASGLRVSELAHLRVEDVNLRARSLIVCQGKGGKDRIGLFGRKAAEALDVYLGNRKTGPLFVRDPRKQRGGVTRGKYGDWWGQWRENGVLRSVRLGDYELPTKERARQALDAFLKDKLPELRFNEHGLKTRSIYRIVVTAAKRAGIEGVHPHTMRHSMATHLLNRGVDIRFVQEILGHEGLGATQKYLHIAISRLQEVHKLLERG